MSGADLSGLASGGMVGTPNGLPAQWELIEGYLIGPDADLTGADLVGADLKDLNLTGADLTAADLAGANLWAADTTAAVWSDTTCPDGTNSDTDGDTCANNQEGDDVAQGNLNTALTNAKAYATQNNQAYGSTDAAIAALTTNEPSLTWTASASLAPDQISLAASADGNGIILAAESTTGNCWYVIDNRQSEGSDGGAPWSEPGALFAAAGTYVGEVKSLGTPPTCAASAAPVGPNSATQAINSGFQFPDL